MRGQKSRNPYHAKGFWLSDDIEILFDIFSSEENQLLHFPLRNKTNVFLRESFFFNPTFFVLFFSKMCYNNGQISLCRKPFGTDLKGVYFHESGFDTNAGSIFP